ncbi:hypothetical protein BRARA_F00374 [Brassica rapa]|uniref:PI3K/PI4K catalytic domain-containing protein n=1 Tax=Brassica campestris TaxID=3711 RepID=A0A397YUF9_BRACM|nr:hypothetical protein BRARA_F00374 [Brassica rapa]
MQKFRSGLQLLEDRIYRTSLGWFAHQPEWYDVNIPNFCQSEALSVSVFVNFLSNELSDLSQSDSKGKPREIGNLIDVTDQYHPVWGEMDNYTVGKEKRKQLLLMLCQHEADRLDVWAQPISSKDSPYSRLKISSEKWTEHAKTAFSSAHFKLSHEMTQLLDPSGVMKSKTWHQFVSLCVKGYLAARRYMDGIISTVQMMLDSGLPCFSRGDPIGNLRKRFHPEMSEREAAHFMIHVCTDAYNKWTTAGYDLIQYLQQGIEK